MDKMRLNLSHLSYKACKSFYALLTTTVPDPFVDLSGVNAQLLGQRLPLFRARELVILELLSQSVKDFWCESLPGSFSFLLQSDL